MRAGAETRPYDCEVPTRYVAIPLRKSRPYRLWHLTSIFWSLSAGGHLSPASTATDFIVLCSRS